MKRVAHPTCSRCGSRNPDYESTLFKIRMCYRCVRDVADWFCERGLLQSNPLVEELLSGVFEGGTVPTTNQFTVIVQSRFLDKSLTDNSYSYLRIDKTAPVDSTKKFSTWLDKD